VTGTVLFGVGTGVFGYLAWSKNQDWKDTWDEQAREDGRLYGNLATGLAIATVGFAAVTIWTTLFSGSPICGEPVPVLLAGRLERRSGAPA
jgi:hypothetical protein